MDNPDEDTTVAAYLEHSAFSCAAVFADESVRGLEKPLEGTHVGLKSAQRALEDMGEDVQRKLGVLVQLDRKTDKVVGEFVARLLMLVDKNYEHPTYRRYVPKSLRDITQAEMREEEPKKVAEIIVLLDEDKNKAGIGELATEFIPRLTTANAAVIAGNVELTKAENAAKHQDEKVIPGLMVDWGIEYRKLEAALTNAWPLEPERVQRCFKSFRKAKKKTKKPDEPAADPTTGAKGASASTGATPTATPPGATGGSG